MHKSVATIESPEFINLQPLEINPLMSKCEIKVLYLGENRNHTYITKEVASEMAKTLRGAPIVGYYKEEKEDFRDHGQQVIVDDEGIKFLCNTKPYGFVSLDAEVWFQKFEDTDDFGNVIEREYLMTTGYLWTGQYEECKSVIESGKNQSMELEEKSLDGYWSTNSNTGMDFFIINDAIFSKLCILGDDVEPCFEGARVTAPEVSSTFTKIDDTFKKTLFSMLEDLKKYTIEGGQSMDIDNTQNVETVEVEETVNTTDVQPEATEFEATENAEVTAEEDTTVETEIETEVEEEETVVVEEEVVEEVVEPTVEETEYALLQEQYNTLSAQYSELQANYETLVAFKKEIEDKEKDNLIAQFYMLSDAEKADVIAHKSEYTLEEIEAKLSVICVRNKVSFSTEETVVPETNSEVITTFNFQDVEEDVPGYILALRNVKNKNNC